MNYRMGGGLTGTLRAGKFLARDLGVRMEVKRRFESGFELGAWYTRTDANDTTGPAASEGGVYYDKGVFARIAFDALGTRDTRARGAISLSAWGRDPGQMVASPGDLYGIVESPLRHNLYKGDGLGRLADVDDDPTLPSLGTGFLDRPILELATPGILDSFDVFSTKNGWRYLALAGGLTALSTAADKSVDKWAVRHQDDHWVDMLSSAGNGLPVLAVGLAGIAASDATDPRLARTGLSSLIATGTGLVISELSKRAVGRSRPDAEKGPSDFSASGDDGSFPSNHTTAMWAAVTPFAKEYDAPWLYGVAALTNFSRVATRRHWFSDTVAGALLGYGIGSLLWEARRGKRDDSPAVYLTGNGVGVSVPLK
jgi:membrane-associated phospholipid phosphatase